MTSENNTVKIITPSFEAIITDQNVARKIVKMVMNMRRKKNNPRVFQKWTDEEEQRLVKRVEEDGMDPRALASEFNRSGWALMQKYNKIKTPTIDRSPERETFEI